MHGPDNNFPSLCSRRIRIANNLMENVTSQLGTGAAFQFNGGPYDVTIEHNTLFQTGMIIAAGAMVTQGLVFRNNLLPHNECGVKGDGRGSGNETINTYFPGSVFRMNVMVGGPGAVYPPDNFFPPSFVQVGFTDQAGGNYRLTSASPYKNAGTDGKDLGCDIDALIAAQSSTPAPTPTPIPTPTPTPTPTATPTLMPTPTNLVLGARYYYRVKSSDAPGHLAVSREFTLRKYSSSLSAGFK